MAPIDPTQPPPSHHQAANTSDIETSPALAEWLRVRQAQKSPRFGVSFNNVSCHGFLSSSRSQQTVTTRLLAIPRYIANLAASRKEQPQRVQILNEINGLVRSGEMLLVLGRPGSGCTTLLKTLAGDIHGFHLDRSNSRFSYEGKGIIALLPIGGSD